MIKVFIKRKILSIQTILRARARTHTHTHTHTSILTIRSLIYTHLKKKLLKNDFSRMKTAARNGKHGRCIVLVKEMF